MLSAGTLTAMPAANEANDTEFHESGTSADAFEAVAGLDAWTAARLVTSGLVGQKTHRYRREQDCSSRSVKHRDDAPHGHEGSLSHKHLRLAEPNLSLRSDPNLLECEGKKNIYLGHGWGSECSGRRTEAAALGENVVVSIRQGEQTSNNGSVKGISKHSLVGRHSEVVKEVTSAQPAFPRKALNSVRVRDVNALVTLAHVDDDE
jgi:hypothetical protein